MPEAKKGRGCFFYGCITLMILVIVAVVAILIGVRYGYKYARDHFTSTKPSAVPPAALSTAEGARVTQRVDDFKKALETGKANGPIELTGDELDYVFRNTPGNGLRDHAHITINNDRVHAQLSLPLDMYGPTWFGRFFNGEADVDVKVRDGAVVFQLQHPTVNGRPLPAWAQAKISQGTEWHVEASDANAVIATNLDKVEIKDDKIILYPRGK
jgi:hypothetical protein